MQRKVQTSHQEGVVVAWFKLKTGKAIHRTGWSVREAGFHELNQQPNDAGEEVLGGLCLMRGYSLGITAPPASPCSRTLNSPCLPFHLASHPWLRISAPSTVKSSSIVSMNPYGCVPTRIDGDGCWLLLADGGEAVGEDSWLLLANRGEAVKVIGGCCWSIEVFTTKINEQFKAQNCNCLVLLDNATSHSVADATLVNDLRALSLATNVKQAIIWLLDAISWSTIINCWCKAGILPEEWCRELRPTSAAAIAAEAAEEAPLREIASAIQRLPVGYTI
ncbi:hypothetical protein EMCRGX_G032966 [Ephydatia muelleri]